MKSRALDGWILFSCDRGHRSTLETLKRERPPARAAQVEALRKTRRAEEREELQLLKAVEKVGQAHFLCWFADPGDDGENFALLKKLHRIEERVAEVDHHLSLPPELPSFEGDQASDADEDEARPSKKQRRHSSF